MNRKEGLYWVKFDGDKKLTVAYYNGMAWRIIGQSGSFPDGIFSDVSTHPIPQPIITESIHPDEDIRIPGVGC